jgi:outer membrane biosynthesis protein TonB
VNATALESGGTWRWWAAVGVAVLVSVLAHGAIAATLSTFEIPERSEERWVQVELDVAEPEPEPEQEEPEPEPDPEPRDEPIEYDQTATEAQPTAEPVPDDQPKKVRRIRRLSKDSVTEGGVPMGAPAGGTGSIDIEPSGDPEGEIVDYAAAATQPKVRYKPKLAIPQEVIDAEIEGSVQVTVTVLADGKTSDVVVIVSLGAAADAACVANALQSRWKPSKQGDVAVPVKGVPYTCTFRKAID